MKVQVTGKYKLDKLDLVNFETYIRSPLIQWSLYSGQ